MIATLSEHIEELTAKLQEASLSFGESTERIHEISEQLQGFEDQRTTFWDKYRKERHALHDLVPERYRWNADWYNWCAPQMQALNDARDEFLNSVTIEIKNYSDQLIPLQRQGEKTERLCNEYTEKVEALRDEYKMKLSAIRSTSTWSESHEALYRHNLQEILTHFPESNAPSTDSLLSPEEIKYITYPSQLRSSDYMALRKKGFNIDHAPHIRALAGLLVYLESRYGEPLSGTPEERFEILFRHFQISTIVEVGSGNKGPILSLGRIGIPKKLNIELYAIDMQDLDKSSHATYKNAGVDFIKGDANQIKNVIRKPIDLIISCGVLSPGGQQEYLHAIGQTCSDDSSQLRYISQASHTLARNLVSALSDNSVSALVATAWFGSLALQEDLLSDFARIKLWQFCNSSEEGDKRFRETNDELNDALLKGIKLAVIQKS